MFENFITNIPTNVYKRVFAMARTPGSVTNTPLHTFIYSIVRSNNNKNRE